MIQPTVIADRETFDAAAALLATHGRGAVAEAERLAGISRTNGNVRRFCRWRQTARLIDALNRADRPARLN